MKVMCSRVIIVIIKLQDQVIFKDTCSQSTKVSSIYVISVKLNLQILALFRSMLSQYMRVSSIRAVSVIFSLHTRLVCSVTSEPNTVSNSDETNYPQKNICPFVTIKKILSCCYKRLYLVYVHYLVLFLQVFVRKV